MTLVFVLVLYLGQNLQESNMYFYDINRCRYFAKRIMKQPPVPDTKKTPAEAGATNPRPVPSG